MTKIFFRVRAIFECIENQENIKAKKANQNKIKEKSNITNQCCSEPRLRVSSPGFATLCKTKIFRQLSARSILLAPRRVMSSTTPFVLTEEDRAGLTARYKACLERVGAAAKATPSDVRAADRSVRLVAVSKTHPSEVLQAVYDAGCRVFGENYTVEIVEKAPKLPSDIEWHFVGHLQSNKVKELLSSVPSLSVIESVDTEKLARKLNDGVVLYRSSSSADGPRRLGVMVQVNTSGEESKSGVEPAVAPALAEFIVKNCPNLILKGFMTIGMPDYTSRPENFACLAEVRERSAKALGVDPATLDLSMGMSGDFENAIAMGSTNVRVGTTIFGSRRYPIKDIERSPPNEEVAKH